MLAMLLGKASSFFLGIFSCTFCDENYRPGSEEQLHTGNNHTTKEGKLLSLFTVVQFNNFECSAGNRTGSCITASQVCN